MRRYAVTERPRAELLTDLLERIRREEHLNPDRPDRAEAYRIAHQLLQGETTEVRARATLFRVAEYASAAYSVTEGTRAQLLAELDQYGADRAQQGKAEKAREFARALDELENGADEVRVGHTVYRVVGE
jgi:hypothetical protein